MLLFCFIQYILHTSQKAFKNQRWLHYKCQRHLIKVTGKKTHHQTNTRLHYCSVTDYDSCAVVL